MRKIAVAEIAYDPESKDLHLQITVGKTGFQIHAWDLHEIADLIAAGDEAGILEHEAVFEIETV